MSGSTIWSDDCDIGEWRAVGGERRAGWGAGLPGCGVARLRGCEVAGLRGCEADERAHPQLLPVLTLHCVAAISGNCNSSHATRRAARGTQDNSELRTQDSVLGCFISSTT